MKINKDLLPMKFHYFFLFAGAAPLIPFLPVYAMNHLQISYSGIGLIYTVLPFLGFISKMGSGALADFLSAHRKMLLMSVVVSCIGFFSIYFVPSMPTKANTEPAVVHFDCSSPTSYLKHIYPKENCKLDRFKGNETATCNIICKSTLKNVADICQYWNVSMPSNTEEINMTTFSELSWLVDDAVNVFFPVSNLTFMDDEIHHPMCQHPVRLNCTAKCLNDDLMMLLGAPNHVQYHSYSDILNKYQFWLYFAFISVAWCGYAVLVVMSDTICFQLLGVAANKYGKQRMFGSMGWGVMVIVTGLLIDCSSEGNLLKNFMPAFILSAAVFSIDLLVASRLKVEVSLKGQSTAHDVAKLFVQPRIYIFIVCCIIVGVSTGVLWTYQFMLVERVAFKWDCNFRYIKLLEGLMMGVASFGGELPFFFISGLFIKKLGHVNSMSLVIAVFGLRYILYFTVVNPWVFLPIELLNGFTFGIFYAVMTSYASIVAPPGSEATMQGIVGASFEGLGIALGGLIGGALCKNVGEASAFLYVGIFNVIFAILHVVTQILLNKFCPSKLSGSRADGYLPPSEGFNVVVDDEDPENEQVSTVN